MIRKEKAFVQIVFRFNLDCLESRTLSEFRTVFNSTEKQDSMTTFLQSRNLALWSKTILHRTNAEIA